MITPVEARNLFKHSILDKFMQENNITDYHKLPIECMSLNISWGE